ncbi:MAG: hypothetical protein JNJ54_30775 [Myxococcaceae bacterium]|nr:hypothetical protein [Myxococcaceae bacterium]
MRWLGGVLGVVLGMVAGLFLPVLVFAAFKLGTTGSYEEILPASFIGMILGAPLGGALGFVLGRRARP